MKLRREEREEKEKKVHNHITISVAGLLSLLLSHTCRKPSKERRYEEREEKTLLI